MRVVTPEGRSATDWQPLIESAPWRRIEDVAERDGTLIVLGAHPDDETIGAGRLVSAWTRRRGEVTAVSMSAGEACLDHLGIHLPDLADVRRAEFQVATAELGVSRSLCWSLPDGELTDYLPYVVQELTALIDGAAAVAAPWRFDPHPDHAALGNAAASVCRELATPLLEYPIWSSYWQPPEEPAAHGYRPAVIRTNGHDTDARDRALSQYRSQLRSLYPDLEPVVPPAMLEHHRQQILFETSQAMGSSSAPDQHWSTP